MQKVREVLKVLDSANLQLRVDKCKMQGITKRLRPGNLRELRSFFGVVNQLNKFVPDLANTCAPFRSKLKKEAEWKWTQEHEKAFLKVNQEEKE